MKYTILLLLLCCTVYGWGQNFPKPPNVRIHKQPSVPKPDLTPPPAPDFSQMIPLPVGDYLDPAAATATYAELWLLEMVEEAHDNTVKEIRKIVPTVAAENLAREDVNPTKHEVLAVNYRGLCDGFMGGGLNRKKRLCDAKKAYLLKASKVVNDLVYAGTRYKVDNGVVDQIAEKYTSIINTLRYELHQMEIERRRRNALTRILSN